jgi:glyoxylate/hydroxypyruvate reductase A
MKMLLLAPEFDFNEEWRVAFKESMPYDELYEVDQIVPEDIEIAIVYNPPPKVLCRFSNLKAIFNLSAGVDVLLSDNTLPDVPIVRLVSYEIVQLMREYIVYQTLRIHRDFKLVEQQQQQREWRWMPSYPPASHRRVSVLGLGRLGLPSAIALSAIGFKVSGWSKSQKDIPNITCFSGEDGLSLLLSQTDILVCLLPLTEATKKILSSPLFYKLPQGVCLINASRGGCLNEEDLLKEIDSGKIEHATLDVFSTEPLPLTHPFWMNPHINITPHMAAEARPYSTALEVAGMTYRIRNGISLVNLVCRDKGY